VPVVVGGVTPPFSGAAFHATAVAQMKRITPTSIVANAAFRSPKALSD
jgi:hypothetical protein